MTYRYILKQYESWKLPYFPRRSLKSGLALEVAVSQPRNQPWFPRKYLPLGPATHRRSSTSARCIEPGSKTPKQNPIHCPALLVAKPLIDWLIGWFLFDCLIVWLFDWFTFVWLVDWFTFCSLVDWLICLYFLLFQFFADQFYNWGKKEANFQSKIKTDAVQSIVASIK